MHYASQNQPLSIASLINSISLYITDDEICQIVENVGYEEILFDTLVDKVSFKVAKLLENIPFKDKGTYWMELALLTLVGNVIDRYYDITKETKINFNTFDTYDLVIVKDINGKPKPKFGWRTKELKTNDNINYIKIKGQRFGTVYVSKQIRDYQEEVTNNTFCMVRASIGGFDINKLLDLHATLLFQKEVSSKKNESPMEFKARLSNDAQIVKNLVGTTVSYTTFFDSRGRDYASLEYGFIKPYGNKFESRLLEQEPYKVSAKGLKRLKWYVVCLAEDVKLSLTEGVKRFSKSKYKSLRTKLTSEVNQQFELMEDLELGFDTNIKPMLPKQLGNILYLIDAIDASMLKVGDLTTFYPEIDMVNSGLIHTANMFRFSNSLLTIANLKGRKRFDSHTVNLEIIKKLTGREYSRDDIKQLISQPLFHGARLETIAKGMDLDKDILDKALEESFTGYGIINQMSEFGKKIHLNNNPSIKWTMPDGFVATSTGYSRNNMVIIRVDDTKYHLNVMMPLLTINKFPFKSRNKSVSADGDVVNSGTINKGYGLWANIN